jgi:ADP-ribose pyrophosphatase YjhB (NUDIX family)
MKHRIRVVGILRRGEQILLVEQQNPLTGHRRWTPPGGGLEISDPDIFAGVEREVFEETGLQVRAGQVRFVSEYANTLDNPILALSIWIECQPVENDEFGIPSLANTLPDDYITDVKWWDRAELFGKENVSASLQKNEFWETLDLPDLQVGHLGRRTD